MTAPGPAAESVLSRAAGIEDVAATLGELAPNLDIARAVRMFSPFPGEPDALDGAATDYLRTAEETERTVDDFDRQMRGLLGAWQGQTADAAARSSVDVLERVRVDARNAREVGTALRELSDALRPEQREHARLADLLGELQLATLPFGPPLTLGDPREQARAALLEAAGLLRRVHDHDQAAAARIRSVLGEVGDGIAAPGSAPADGGRLVGLDAPAQGQSGVQQAGPFIVLTLNDADTQKLVDGGSLGGISVGAVGGVAAAVVAGLAPPVAVVAGQALALGKLADMNRSPEGVRVYFLGTQFVRVTAR